MKLENQVCTLEQAKRLKELGVRQDGSLAVWFISSVGPCIQFRLNEETLPQEFAAYTVAELGVLLPTGYDTMKLTGELPEETLWYGYDDRGVDYPNPQDGYKTEAECRAAMLLHLIESNSYTIDQINKSITPR